MIRTPHADLTLEDIASVLPGTGEIMARVGDAWWKCAYAARGGNWPLAAHFAARVRALQRSLMILRPKYREQLEAFEKNEIAAVIAAVKARDQAGFDRAFTAGTDRANELHAATSHAYVRWVLPDEPPKGLDLGNGQTVDRDRVGGGC
ncbi:MAG: hypothetical protein ACRDGT_03930 [Candidatus Limnocylindria bacterium]